MTSRLPWLLLDQVSPTLVSESEESEESETQRRLDRCANVHEILVEVQLPQKLKLLR